MTEAVSNREICFYQSSVIIVRTPALFFLNFASHGGISPNTIRVKITTNKHHRAAILLLLRAEWDL